MDKLFIFTNVAHEHSNDSYIAKLDKDIRHKDVLFKELNETLDFPHFGYNWDALWDLMNDFHWIKNKEIVLVHVDIPLVSEKENLKYYLQILRDAVTSWKTNPGPHLLKVVFPLEAKETIEKLMIEIELDEK
ncbi:hypothetical protein COU74_01240 [Candidatus Peregrinibacteria bacterium CG10_big_fil_rev_8_21_14_0_10_36_19]|nr:MAG: hypothetical protein COU74_01240 [Candidatus Peregrinibacteria bacterium CG10_big_fil_rev_8_21_14_0_10_36_19]